MSPYLKLAAFAAGAGLLSALGTFAATKVVSSVWAIAGVSTALTVVAVGGYTIVTTPKTGA
jgi:hypothetical protein